MPFAAIKMYKYWFIWFRYSLIQICSHLLVEDGEYLVDKMVDDHLGHTQRPIYLRYLKCRTIHIYFLKELLFD